MVGSLRDQLKFSISQGSWKPSEVIIQLTHLKRGLGQRTLIFQFTLDQSLTHGLIQTFGPKMLSKIQVTNIKSLLMILHTPLLEQKQENCFPHREGNGIPLQYSCLENPMDRGAWKAPWGRWGSDTTERLHFHFSLSCIGEGNGSPLQCSCLKNPRDGEAWWAAVYGVAQSQTRLKWLSTSFPSQVHHFLKGGQFNNFSSICMSSLSGNSLSFQKKKKKKREGYNLRIYISKSLIFMKISSLWNSHYIIPLVLTWLSHLWLIHMWE